MVITTLSDIKKKGPQKKAPGYGSRKKRPAYTVSGGGGRLLSGESDTVCSACRSVGRKSVSCTCICRHCHQRGHWAARCPDLQRAPSVAGRTVGDRPPSPGASPSVAGARAADGASAIETVAVAADAASAIETVAVAASATVDVRGAGDAAPVGSRIRVWWEGDEAWYEGTVTRISAANGKHHIKYDDGDRRSERLSECTWERLGVQPAAAAVAPDTAPETGADRIGTAAPVATVAPATEANDDKLCVIRIESTDEH